MKERLSRLDQVNYCGYFYTWHLTSTLSSKTETLTLEIPKREIIEKQEKEISWKKFCVSNKFYVSKKSLNMRM